MALTCPYTDRPTFLPSAPQAYQCLISHFLPSLGACNLIVHPHFDQLTTVKTVYPLTSIAWPYRGLRYRHTELVFSTKVLPSGDGTDILRARAWKAEPCSFLSFFLSPAPGIEPPTYRSGVKRPTGWPNPAAKKTFGCISEIIESRSGSHCPIQWNFGRSLASGSLWILHDCFNMQKHNFRNIVSVDVGTVPEWKGETG